MITFYFENGCILTLRTSGTEPKIKWYSEIRQTDMAKQDFMLMDVFINLFIESLKFKGHENS